MNALTRDELFDSEEIALNWPLIVDFVAEWLDEIGATFTPPSADAAARWASERWREEMSNG